MFDTYKVPTKGTMLEIGCHEGIISGYLSEHCPRLHLCSIDNNRDSIQHAQKHTALNYPHIDFSVGTAYHTRKGDHMFDVLYNRLAYKYLTDPIKSLDEARRVLKPEGHIVITELHDDFTILAPELESVNKILEQSRLRAESTGTNPRSETQIPHYLEMAGYKNINMGIKSFSSAEIGIENLICLMIALYSHAFGANALEAIKNIKDDITRMKQHPFGMIAVTVTIAQV